MKYWYAEIILTDEENEKLKKWEKENKADGELLLKKILMDFLNKL